MPMYEVTFYGRGGQGSVTAAELLAIAAFKDGLFCQAFPYFGVERRGAPVQAFCRIDKKPIRLRSQIYKSDLAVVQDPTLLGLINLDVKENGIVLVNSAKKIEHDDITFKTINATKLALDIIGKPIVNTVLLGAIAKLGVVSIDSVVEAVSERFKGELGKKNVEAVKKAYEVMR